MTIQTLSTDWHITESMDTYRSFDQYARPVGFEAGQRGYVKRSNHNPDYLAVLMRDLKGGIHGWWIKASECEELLIVLKPAPPNSDPELRWRSYWRASFRT